MEKTDVYLDPRNYIHWGQWKQPVLSWSFWEYWSLTSGAKKIPLDLDYTATPIFVVNGHFFMYKSEFYGKLIKTFYNELSGGNTVLTDYFFKEIEYIDKKIVNFIEKNKYIKSEEYIKDVFDIHRESMFAWAGILPFDSALNKKTEEVCIKHNCVWQDIVGFFTMPIKPMSIEDRSRLFEYKKILEQLGIKNILSIKEIELADKNVANDILNYQKDTEYMGTHHFWGEARKLEELLKAISLVAEIKEDEKCERHFPKEVVDIAEINVRAAAWRLRIAERLAQLEYSARDILSDLASKFEIKYDDLIYLSDKEITNLLKTNLLSAEMKMEIQARRKNFAGIINENGELQIWTGAECQQFENIFLKSLERENTQLDENIITGSVASGGIVMGNVDIVLDPKDIKKVEKGMILVAPATSPDYLPAMQNAVAFITDTGGITCHAAIVAREMKKPCIIGTKIATQVLHDGDLVEVDANKGIIKVLNKK